LTNNEIRRYQYCMVLRRDALLRVNIWAIRNFTCETAVQQSTSGTTLC